MVEVSRNTSKKLVPPLERLLNGAALMVNLLSRSNAFEIVSKSSPARKNPNSFWIPKFELAGESSNNSPKSISSDVPAASENEASEWSITVSVVSSEWETLNAAGSVTVMVT